MRGFMAINRVSLEINRIREMQEKTWGEEIAKVSDEVAYPGRGDPTTLREKVRYELKMEWRRRRSWELESKIISNHSRNIKSRG